MFPLDMAAPRFVLNHDDKARKSWLSSVSGSNQAKPQPRCERKAREPFIYLRPSSVSETVLVGLRQPYLFD